MLNSVRKCSNCAANRPQSMLREGFCSRCSFKRDQFMRKVSTQQSLSLSTSSLQRLSFSGLRQSYSSHSSQAKSPGFTRSTEQSIQFMQIDYQSTPLVFPSNVESFSGKNNYNFRDSKRDSNRDSKRDSQRNTKTDSWRYMHPQPSVKTYQRETFRQHVPATNHYRDIQKMSFQKQPDEVYYRDRHERTSTVWYESKEQNSLALTTQPFQRNSRESINITKQNPQVIVLQSRLRRGKYPERRERPITSYISHLQPDHSRVALFSPPKINRERTSRSRLRSLQRQRMERSGVIDRPKSIRLKMRMLSASKIKREREASRSPLRNPLMARYERYGQTKRWGRMTLPVGMI